MLSTSLERKSVLSVSLIFFLRILGVSVILPIFSFQSDKIIDSTPKLNGIMLGVYGFSQALFQIIFGLLSDKYGRKLIILLGLVTFTMGSIFIAESHTVYGTIIGRILQGIGAIGSTLIALVSDLTSEANRTRAMSIVGMTIGLSFISSIILGPILNNFLGFSGVFRLVAFFGVISIFVLYYLTSNTSSTFKITTPKNYKSTKSQFRSVLFNPKLLCLNYSVFNLHSMLTSLFLVIPFFLIDYTNVNSNSHWLIYLLVLFIASFLSILIIAIAETKKWMKTIFISAVAFLIVSQILLLLVKFCIFYFNYFDSYYINRVLIISILILYFTSFTWLEAALPSLISKIVPNNVKGVAMGTYSSAQFFGIFKGGFIGGIILHYYGVDGIFFYNSFLGLLWWFIVYFTMKKLDA